MGSICTATCAGAMITGCAYTTMGGATLPMLMRPYTPGWLMSMETPTLVPALAEVMAPAAMIKATNLFMMSFRVCEQAYNVADARFDDAALRLIHIFTWIRWSLC